MIVLHFSFGEFKRIFGRHEKLGPKAIFQSFSVPNLRHEFLSNNKTFHEQNLHMRGTRISRMCGWKLVPMVG